ncbi:hypothetical protein GEMRC1_013050 [Eukaryota sp. GEM-RC1]
MGTFITLPVNQTGTLLNDVVARLFTLMGNAEQVLELVRTVNDQSQLAVSVLQFDFDFSSGVCNDLLNLISNSVHFSDLLDTLPELFSINSTFVNYQFPLCKFGFSFYTPQEEGHLADSEFDSLQLPLFSSSKNQNVCDFLAPYQNFSIFADLSLIQNQLAELQRDCLYPNPELSHNIEAYSNTQMNFQYILNFCQTIDATLLLCQFPFSDDFGTYFDNLKDFLIQFRTKLSVVLSKIKKFDDLILTLHELGLFLSDLSPIFCTNLLLARFGLLNVSAVKTFNLFPFVSEISLSFSKSKGFAVKSIKLNDGRFLPSIDVRFFKSVKINDVLIDLYSAVYWSFAFSLENLEFDRYGDSDTTDSSVNLPLLFQKVKKLKNDEKAKQTTNDFLNASFIPFVFSTNSKFSHPVFVNTIGKQKAFDKVLDGISNGKSINLYTSNQSVIISDLISSLRDQYLDYSKIFFLCHDCNHFLHIVKSKTDDVSFVPVLILDSSDYSNIVDFLDSDRMETNPFILISDQELSNISNISISTTDSKLFESQLKKHQNRDLFETYQKFEKSRNETNVDSNMDILLNLTQDFFKSHLSTSLISFISSNSAKDLSVLIPNIKISSGDELVSSLLHQTTSLCQIPGTIAFYFNECFSLNYPLLLVILQQRLSLGFPSIVAFGSHVMQSESEYFKNVPFLLIFPGFPYRPLHLCILFQHIVLL